MKILHLTSSLEVGGAQRMRLELIRKLIAMGHDPDDHVLGYFKDGPMRRKFENLGIETCQVAGDVTTYGFGATKKLNKILGRFKPDLIHSQLWAANIFARLMARRHKIKVVCDLHCMTETQGWAKNLVDRLLPLKADRWIAVSDGIARAFESYWSQAALGQGSKAYNKIVTIKNGVDAGKFKFSFGDRDDMREELDIDEEAFVVGAVGRLEPEKNFDHLIKAFAKVCERFEAGQSAPQAPYRSLKLVIAGQGSLAGELKGLAKKLGVGDKVIFGSATGRIYRFYSSFDCMAVSSRAEGLSMALLEALCSGLPVVVATRGQFHEVIESGRNGQLVPFGDIDAMADQLYGLLVSFDPEFRNRPPLIGSEFDVEAVAERYDELYKEVLEQ